MPTNNLFSLAGSHDLRLSNWGPYSKHYAGISHIPDIKAGLRFDLSMFPELFRSKVKVPNAKRSSDYHPREAAPDLSYFSYRHQVIWKDRLYCDVSFVRLDDQAVLFRCACVNQTSLPQNVALHFIAALHFPPRKIYSNDILRVGQVQLPKNGVWVDGTQYQQLDYAPNDPRTNLTEDGHLRGEVIDHGFTGGQGLGKGFGRHAGDTVTYKIPLATNFNNGLILLRYRLKEKSSLRLSFSGVTAQTIDFDGNGEFALQRIPIGKLHLGEAELTIKSLGGTGTEIEIDGLALVEEELVSQVYFQEQVWNPEPEWVAGPKDGTLLLKYEHINTIYGLAWDDQIEYRMREFVGDDLDGMMQDAVNQHPKQQFLGSGEGHFTNIFLQPIYLHPNSEQVFYGLVCAGTETEVNNRLARFDSTSPDNGDIYQGARKKRVDFTSDSSGKPYQFSQERMAATLLTNAIYPVRTRGTWIRHYAPGRQWDCLYTWDSGFIGLGLLELDEDKAIDCLNAYVTELDVDDAVFIHHGSPIPVQHYLFHELWNRTQSEELLEYFFPRLRRYHRFLVGRLGSSTTRTSLNLLKTWDYFYNSGGWDDYPPQTHVHFSGLDSTTAPVVTTAHCIRTARTLKMAGEALGEPTGEFEEDIEMLSNALQKYSWDEESGYFSYVIHNSDGTFDDILKHPNGQNFNMGLDGVCPLVAGICSPEQETRIIDHLMSEKHLWTPHGISTVDQSAAYYQNDGYWNGAVWMSHQWFIWKALLDLGKTNEAYRIARTALDLWQREVDASYNCYEHFMIESGRGAGWHHFGGLSAPVLNWFNTYHVPGCFTTGLNIWVVNKSKDDKNKSLQADLKLDSRSNRSPAVIAGMNENYQYSISWNSDDIPFTERYPGTLEIHLPIAGRSQGQLSIQPKL